MDNSQPIYTIMPFNYEIELDTLNDNADEFDTMLANMAEVTDSRVVGYYYSLEEAQRAVKTNRCDLWETMYAYAVIEEVNEGLYRPSMKRWFYRYNMKLGQYEPIEEPSEFKHLCGFTIG